MSATGLGVSGVSMFFRVLYSDLVVTHLFTPKSPVVYPFIRTVYRVLVVVWRTHPSPPNLNLVPKCIMSVSRGRVSHLLSRGEFIIEVK
jgi:hypothetical protein